jgi:hypothetical protein
MRHAAASVTTAVRLSRKHLVLVDDPYGGCRVKCTPVEWIGPPHYWFRGR